MIAHILDMFAWAQADICPLGIWHVVDVQSVFAPGPGVRPAINQIVNAIKKTVKPVNVAGPLSGLFNALPWFGRKVGLAGVVIGGAMGHFNPSGNANLCEGFWVQFRKGRLRF